MLCSAPSKLLASIDEKNVIQILLAFFEYKNAGRDASAVKDVRGQADDSVEVIAVLYQIFANMRLGRPAKKNAVRSDYRHRTVLGKVMHHMLNERPICLGTWRQSPVLR